MNRWIGSCVRLRYSCTDLRISGGSNMAKTLLPWIAVMGAAIAAASGCSNPSEPKAGATGLWQVYDQTLKSAKYIDLTHTITPTVPVWKGFGPSKFLSSAAPETGKP